MHFGQPPSWRPDQGQLEVESYRGTVRDALGGLRNLEQLLGSLRVGPRALLSVLPDIQGSCAPLRNALSGLAQVVALKMADAADVVGSLSQSASAQLSALSEVLETIGKSTFNAKARLRLEERVVATRTDVESIFELIDLLGEAAWGRAILLDLSEVAREAFRSSEPPGTAKAAIRVSLVPSRTAIEREASPRGLGLLLNLLVRFAVHEQAALVPRVVFVHDADTAEVRIEPETGTGELRWSLGRHCRPETETCLLLAARAMSLDLSFGQNTRLPRLVFAAT